MLLQYNQSGKHTHTHTNQLTRFPFLSGNKVSISINITCGKKHILSSGNHTQFPGFSKNCWNCAEQSMQHLAAYTDNILQPYKGESSRTTDTLYKFYFIITSLPSLSFPLLILWRWKCVCFNGQGTCLNFCCYWPTLPTVYTSVMYNMQNYIILVKWLTAFACNSSDHVCLISVPYLILTVLSTDGSSSQCSSQ